MMDQSDRIIVPSEIIDIDHIFDFFSTRRRGSESDDLFIRNIRVEQ